MISATDQDAGGGGGKENNDGANTLSPSSEDGAAGPQIQEERKSSPVPDEEQDVDADHDTCDGADDNNARPKEGPTADWSPEADPKAHMFIKASSARLKCVACRTYSTDRGKPCRETFREGIRKYREKTSIEHHWVERRQLAGKCKHCGKSFKGMLGFSSKEVVGVSCSWCKYSYHNREACLKERDEYDKECDLGNHASMIVPPSWILKVPRKGSFKSSLKNSPNKNRRRQRAGELTSSISIDSASGNPPAEGSGVGVPAVEPFRPFCIKPIPNTSHEPVLVFLNPKSGGNQGAKLMQKFQWLLNPRQVFDLTQGGPMPAIEMFRKVPNVKLLACGGDGTVGWLLSVLDKVRIEPAPAVSVLPLGTGNDLSRSLGWGGGYIDEPISKILSGLQNAEIVTMDRWQLNVTRNKDIEPSEKKGKDELPLNVVNNYFSMGVDAHIALEFHEAREANPQKFNSRIRNKMFYGQAGGKDLLLRKWKDLSDEIEVECDGKDITPKLRELRVHSVLFANIPSFGSGTRPWDPAKGEQKINDGMIEVIGLTTYQLPMLQGGLHGSCITQCKTAKIRTKKTISMQVDGEASRLNPADIELTLLNQVKMLSKKKGSSKSKISYRDKASPLKMRVSCLAMSDYSALYTSKEKLKAAARPFEGEISTMDNADLEQVRGLINTLLENNDVNKTGKKRQIEWCFIDSVTAIRFFRIDRAQEGLHYVLDICEDNHLYIVFEESDAMDVMEEEVEELSLDTLGAEKKVSTKGSAEVSTKDLEGEMADSFPAVGGNQVGSESRLGNNRDHNENMTGGQSSRSPANHGSGGVVTSNELIVPNGGSHSASPQPSPTVQQVLEKTTEGILKAARLGDLKMLKELHKEGYSLLSIDETGKTALHYGARFGHKEIIRFLLANAPMSVLDIQDNEKGQTALHKAAGYKRRTISCMLVAAGASLLIVDNARLTPRQLAVMAEDNELASYLESQEEFQREKAELGEDLCNEGDFETPV